LAATGLELLGRLLGRRVPLTRYRLRSIKGIRHFDCSAARDRLGWTPRTGVREGLRKTYLTAT
jgi:nucleoside-diphosphate-sugar epimerase